MNKIITINIGGIAISIEEDAFDDLRNYLKNISNHFSQTENGDEIIADIELRIGEMLEAKLKPPKVSVNRSDVEEVAQTMGYPSDFEAEDGEPTKQETNQKPNESTEQTKSEKRRARKLFRDGDNKYVGGVCSGLAKYFDLDPTVLRLLWIISIAVFGFGFWVYVILWAVLPEPKTAAEKLEMMGESPNIENIKNTIHSEAKAAYERITTPANRKSVANFFDSALGLLKRGFGIFFKLFAIAAFVGILILLVVSLIGFVFQGTFMNYGNNVNIDGQVFGLLLVGSGSWLFKIAFYLIFAIPLLFIAMLLLPQVLSVPKAAKPIKQGMVSAWFIAIVVAVFGFFYNAQQYQSEGIVKVKNPLELTSDTIIIRVDDSFSDQLFATDKRVKLNVVQNEKDLVEVQLQKSVRGRSEKTAKELATKIADGYRVSNNTLILTEHILLTQKKDVNAPQYKITLRVPIGKTVIFHESTADVIYNIDNIQDIYDPRMAGHTFKMSEVGFNCEDCKDSYRKSKSEFNGEFSKVEISGALKVKISEGEKQNIEIPQQGGSSDWVTFSIEEGTLTLKQKSGVSIDNRRIKIQMPELSSLKMSGACEAKVNSNNTEKALLSIDLGGAAKVDFENLKVGKVTVDVGGATKLSLSGKGDLLLAETNGASKLYAEDFKVDHANMDMGGSSTAKISVKDGLTGDVNGVSKLSYWGTNNAKLKTSVTARVKKMD